MRERLLLNQTARIWNGWVAEKIPRDILRTRNLAEDSGVQVELEPRRQSPILGPRRGLQHVILRKSSCSGRRGTHARFVSPRNSSRMFGFADRPLASACRPPKIRQVRQLHQVQNSQGKSCHPTRSLLQVHAPLPLCSPAAQ